MRCAHCGAEIGEHELYCPFCGRALPTDELSDQSGCWCKKMWRIMGGTLPP